jgi:gliding motility-associated lipoprotein GldD
MMLLFRISLLLLTTGWLLACGSGESSSSSDSYVPKPRGYPRLDLPPHAYRPVEAGHPYTFEVNRAAVVRPDSFAGAEPDWIFISYPRFGASIQLTYKPVRGDLNRLRPMLADAYKLAAKHNVMAQSIVERPLRTTLGLRATVIELSGEVPSPVQFITTDTTTHFLRGALYLNTATENDSLAPVIEYLRADVLHLLNTLQWRK